MNRGLWYGLTAIGLWGSLASLGVRLAHVPPFLLTGLGLWVGALVALPLLWRQRGLLSWSWSLLALGLYGLFGFHALLFFALQHAPALQANMINYLWPLLMVLLAPLRLGTPWRWRHGLAAGMGLIGAGLAMLSRSDEQGLGGWFWGYGFALASALVWASYSIECRRIASFPTVMMGIFAALSGTLALMMHGFIEPTTHLSMEDGFWILLLGIGPLGGAFFLWDMALKRCDISHLGILSFLTPLLSTLGLLVLQKTWPHPMLIVAAGCIIGAAWVAQDRSKIADSEKSASH